MATKESISVDTNVTSRGGRRKAEAGLRPPTVVERGGTWHIIFTKNARELALSFGRNRQLSRRSRDADRRKIMV